jgi:hypothetical protein
MTRERFKQRLEALEEFYQRRNVPPEIRHICFVDRDRREVEAMVARGPRNFLCRRNPDESLVDFKQRADSECLASKPALPVPILVFLREGAPDAA